MTNREDLIPELIGASPEEYDFDGQEGLYRPVGQGGSSMVFRATYRGLLDRAVKFILPREDLSASVDPKQFELSHRNEVERLASLRHENIVKITDFSTVTTSTGLTYHYMATEFVIGDDLLTFARTPEVTGSELMGALLQILRALDYMHVRGVMHADIKPENVLVSMHQSGNERIPTVTLVDLGSSKYFPPEMTAEEASETVRFYTTTEYVHPGLRLIVANWTNNVITKKNLRDYFPHQDLHSFSVLIKKLLDDNVVKSKLFDSFGQSVLEGVRFIANRLHGVVGNGKYTSSADLLRAFEQLLNSDLSPLGVPELSAVPDGGVVIPVRNSRVAMSARVGNITAHPVFQRLHRLPQLDLLNYVLPGATSSRYVHALHSYELTKSALTKLLSDWRFRIEVSKADLESALLNSVVSSLGHYHFLHMFEDFIIDQKHHSLVAESGLINDSELLDRIMLAEGPGDATNVAFVRDERGRTVADIFNSISSTSWSALRAVRSKPTTPLEGLLSGLHAGPVDVDKISYLIGDSEATGIPFGRFLEPDIIFESLILPHQDDWQDLGGGILVGVREKALPFLEAGVLSRYWSIQSAYWHRTNRSLQAMLKYQIGELLIAGEFSFERYLHDTFHASADSALLWINGEFERARKAEKIDPTAVNPMEGILRSERLIYKRLLTISRASKIESRSRDGRVFQRLQSNSTFDDNEVREIIKAELEKLLPDVGILPGEILLDLPRPHREEAGGKMLVYTDDGREVIGELFRVSPFLERQRESFEHHVKRLRIFVHPRIYELLESNGLVRQAHANALGALRDTYAND